MYFCVFPSNAYKFLFFSQMTSYPAKKNTVQRWPIGASWRVQYILQNMKGKWSCWFMIVWAWSWNLQVLGPLHLIPLLLLYVESLSNLKRELVFETYVGSLHLQVLGLALLCRPCQPFTMIIAFIIDHVHQFICASIFTTWILLYSIL